MRFDRLFLVASFNTLHISPRRALAAIGAVALLLAPLGRPSSAAGAEPGQAGLIRSAHSGAWSSPDTWEGGKVPAANARVEIRPTHRVEYDVVADKPLRSVHVAGTLAFATDRDTRLDVGLLLVRPGEEDVSETDAVASSAHSHDADAPRPALEIGTVERPIDPAHHALIRLTYFDGMDKDAGPALIDCGGRMEIHGTPLARTWLKLRSPAHAGDASVTLDEPVADWHVGDHVIVVTTQKLSLFNKGGVIPSVRDDTQTEDRVIKSVDGQVLTLDRPLGYDHTAEAEFRGEVANLSRNVVVESADPDSQGGLLRGHTMYHHGSAGSVSYAEFRHLGKPGVLGRYSLHFHLCGDSMRGSSIIGASIWDSGNRWLTIHGTNYLVVRDCVGYRSIGHGFFLEDGTEVYNFFDRNLAVQALKGNQLPKQILPFDRNDGAGFWWANSLNSFTRNDAAECDQYGYRFEAGNAPEFDSTLSVRQPDGSHASVDIRTLPFIRFQDNEAHSQRRFGLNLGGVRMVAGNDAYKTDDKGNRSGLNRANTNIGDVDGVGPDLKHPFVIRDLKVWATHWSFHSACPNVFIDGLNVYDSNYGIWRSRVDGAEYNNLQMRKIAAHDVFLPWGGKDNYDEVVNKSLKPVDDLPPVTVITRVERNILGDLEVHGVTTDNGAVTQVLVNGHRARIEESSSMTASMASRTSMGTMTSKADDQSAPFNDWEVRLSGPDADATQVSAMATDAVGNAEKTPHVVQVPRATEKTADAR
jgi:hypothetical protein